MTAAAARLASESASRARDRAGARLSRVAGSHRYRTVRSRPARDLTRRGGRARGEPDARARGNPPARRRARPGDVRQSARGCSGDVRVALRRAVPGPGDCSSRSSPPWRCRVCRGPMSTRWRLPMPRSTARSPVVIRRATCGRTTSSISASTAQPAPPYSCLWWKSLWLQVGPFLRMVVGRLGTGYVVDRHQAAVRAIRARDEAALREAFTVHRAI